MECQKYVYAEELFQENTSKTVNQNFPVSDTSQVAIFPAELQVCTV